MSKENEALAKVDKSEKEMRFVPFGAEDEIKLSIAIIKNLIAVKTKSGKTCSDNEAIKFMMMCQARKLNPFEGDAFLIGYDGRDGATFSLITAHQAFLKRAELNAEYDGMKSGIIVEEAGALVDLEGDFHTNEQKPVGGWAIVYFKNRTKPMKKRVRLARFQKAFGVWQDDPAGMICKCAEADALRSSFPTMLGGLYLKEELNNTEKVEKLNEPVFTEQPEPEKPALIEVSSEPVVVEVPVAKEPVKKEKKANPEYPEQVLEDRILKSGVSVDDVIKAMVSNGSLVQQYKSLGEVLLHEPEVFSLIERQLESIVETIESL